MKEIDAQKVFGTSVKVSRKLLGISQETLAERAELHRTYISDVERGARNPSLKTIIRLADALEVSIATLFPEALKHWKTSGPRGGEKSESFVEILLVEDQPSDVKLTLHAFKKGRIANRVHVVTDGWEALDYLFCRKNYATRTPAERPLVVLLDLSLPGLSGLEVLRTIKADKRTATVHVIILSGSGDEANIAECRRVGASGYIVKPVDWRGFGSAVKKLDLNWVLLKPPAAITEVVEI